MGRNGAGFVGWPPDMGLTGSGPRAILWAEGYFRIMGRNGAGFVGWPPDMGLTGSGPRALLWAEGGGGVGFGFIAGLPGTGLLGFCPRVVLGAVGGGGGGGVLEPGFPGVLEQLLWQESEGTGFVEGGLVREAVAVGAAGGIIDSE